ncbi:hypothetical protein STENM327S_06370 [Streptomyces tendae]
MQEAGRRVADHEQVRSRGRDGAGEGEQCAVARRARTATTAARATTTGRSSHHRVTTGCGIAPGPGRHRARPPRLRIWRRRQCSSRGRPGSRRPGTAAPRGPRTRRTPRSPIPLPRPPGLPPARAAAATRSVRGQGEQGSGHPDRIGSPLALAAAPPPRRKHTAQPPGGPPRTRGRATWHERRPDPALGAVRGRGQPNTVPRTRGRAHPEPVSPFTGAGAAGRCAAGSTRKSSADGRLGGHVAGRETPARPQKAAEVLPADGHRPSQPPSRGARPVRQGR